MEKSDVERLLESSKIFDVIQINSDGEIYANTKIKWCDGIDLALYFYISEIGIMVHEGQTLSKFGHIHLDDFVWSEKYMARPGNSNFISKHILYSDNIIFEIVEFISTLSHIDGRRHGTK